MVSLSIGKKGSKFDFSLKEDNVADKHFTDFFMIIDKKHMFPYRYNKWDYMLYMRA